MQPSPMPVDAWASGTSYEAFIGRWSRLVAREFLAWLGVPAGARWLDVGCGTGALTGAVLASCSPASITGVDPAPAFLEHAVGALTDPRVTLRQGGAEALPLDDAAVDAAVSGLVLNFVPDQPSALREMRRVTRPGGTVAAYVWDYTGGMQLLLFFWAAAVALNPAAAAQQEATRFQLNRPDRLRALFTGAGLDAVDVGEVVVPTPFASFEEYWTPFLAGTGPAPAYTAALGEGERAALREELRGRLPIENDGSIRLTARAWTVKGTVA